MERRRVRLNINGVVCGLITGESEAYMQALADEVGDMMRQIMSASPFVTREAAALTTALSICDDCHKNAELAARLKERKEELEVEAELWQEEKVELLKSAVDTQKDAQLAEKAARLESENTRLEEHIQRLKEVVIQARAIEDENAALREAMKSAEEPSENELRLEAENRELTAKLAALEERLAQAKPVQAPAEAAAEDQPAQKPKPKPRRRRSNPIRDFPELEQEGLVSFFEKDKADNE